MTLCDFLTIFQLWCTAVKRISSSFKSQQGHWLKMDYAVKPSIKEVVGGWGENLIQSAPNQKLTCLISEPPIYPSSIMFSKGYTWYYYANPISQADRPPLWGALINSEHGLEVKWNVKLIRSGSVNSLLTMRFTNKQGAQLTYSFIKKGLTGGCLHS